MSPKRWLPRSSGKRIPPLALTALLGLSVVSLFWVGFSVGAALGSLPSPWLPGTDSAPSVPPRIGGGLAGPVTPNESLAVQTNARTLIIYLTSYYECGCTERSSLFAGQDMAGLGERELADLHPGWVVASFGVSEVELHRVLPGLCPDKTEYRTLGVQGGKVTVFLGRPASGLFLHKVTDISLDSLSESDRTRLEAGIVVRGDEAVARYLEGLPD